MALPFGCKIVFLILVGRKIIRLERTAEAYALGQAAYARAINSHAAKPAKACLTPHSARYCSYLQLWRALAEHFPALADQELGYEIRKLTDIYAALSNRH